MSTGSIWYRFIDNNSGGYISSGENIYSDLVKQMGATYFKDLGVNAPPGTQLVLNETKNVMVGRTGLYQLSDDDIKITNVYFVQPKNYVKDEDATKKALEDGADEMAAAEAQRESRMTKLDGQYTTTDDDGNEVALDKDDAYWEEYNDIQSEYITAYQAALATYTSGVNGIYKVDDTNPYKDLENIVVYFKYY